MSEVDEYDAYNNSLDVDNEYYAIFEDFSPTPDASPEPLSRCQATDAPPTQGSESPPHSPKSAYSDEFSAYNLSEFTEEDFAAIDASTRAMRASSSTSTTSGTTKNDTNTFSSTSTRPNARPGNLSGGPAIEIQVEPYTNIRISPMFKAFKGPRSDAMPSTSKSRMPSNNAMQGLNEYCPPLTPFDQFRSRNGTLAVTDLTGPSWCEVQFDYGLRQGRSKKLADRPSTFVTAEGNTITVDNVVATGNDKITTKGKTVHEALEREVHPEELVVEVQTSQERWGLRLVQMINSVHSLISQGRCREMPVCGILHNELIIGVIDCIEREVIPSPAPTLGTTSNSVIENEGSELKRRRDPCSAPATPSKPKSKKACRSPSPTQPPITSFFSPSKAKSNGNGEAPGNSGLASERHTTPVPPELPRFQLHVSDTKTRTHPSIPSEEDTLPSRLQLMLYHKLLSNLLADSLSPQALDFDAIWTRVKLSPWVKFGPKFIEQAALDDFGEPDGQWCLRELVRVFRHSVEALHVEAVDTALTVEYRLQSRRKRKFMSNAGMDGDNGKGKARATEEDVDMGSQADRLEETEVEAALLASPESTPAEVDERADVSPTVHVANGGSTDASGTTSDASSSHQSDAGADEDAGDQQLQWAIYQSLNKTDPASKDDAAASVKDHPPQQTNANEDLKAEMAELDTDKSARKRWTIIGTKTFYYDDQFVENYLTSVLAYWHGRRAPRGVDVTLTRRCFRCEYRDGCEWRAQKADEINNSSTTRTV